MAGENSKENSMINENNGDNSSRDKLQEHGITTELIDDNMFTAEEATNIAGTGMFQVKLIVLSGFVWMARGFDIVNLKSISSLLTCSWDLKLWQGAVINTVSFVCAILGCFLFGIWSDKYGRRMAMSSSLIFLFVFGAVSAGLRSYTWFVIFRALTGLAVGGLPQSLVLCCEYIPGRQRGRAIYILSLFWALGVLIMMFVLYSVRDSENEWNIFTAIGALPAFIAMVLMRFFPESFRFLMVTNHYFAANEIVSEMVENNKKTISGQLIPLETQRPRRLLPDIFRPPLARAALLLWFMGLATVTSFLGLRYMTPQLIFIGKNDDLNPLNTTAMNFLGELNSTIPCFRTLSVDAFVYDTWTTAMDFPGLILYMLFVDVIDRKKLLCASYLISSVFIVLIYIPSLNYIIYVIFIYIARVLLQGQYDLLLLVTAETFPTSHRGTAVGVEASSFYLGRLVSSYVAQSLISLDFKLYPSIGVYGALAFLCAAATLCLKQETRGRDLPDIIKKR